MKNLRNFVAIILTHGRPDNVRTIKTLKACGFSGQIVLAVDDEDKTLGEYQKTYGDMVHVFNKQKIGEQFDKGENFGSQKTIIYARNAAFEIAEKIGCEYFMQLDDDYTSFQWRFNSETYLVNTPRIKSFDMVIDAMIKFYESLPNCLSFAMMQGGDFIGGKHSANAKIRKLKRKCMNSFLCSTKRKFTFVGHFNEDVNTYTTLATRGYLFFSTNQIALGQLATQSNKGGITDFYKKFGTYMKSFQSIVFNPSSVSLTTIGNSKETQRIHHRVIQETNRQDS